MPKRHHTEAYTFLNPDVMVDLRLPICYWWSFGNRNYFVIKIATEH